MTRSAPGANERVEMVGLGDWVDAGAKLLVFALLAFAVLHK